MGLFNFLNICGVNKDYLQAKRALKKAEENINKICMIFPDVSSFDFQLEKNQWTTLPEGVATGVKTMGIHIGDDYRSILVHYEPDSFILPHYHSNEYEVLKIVEGQAKNLINGEIYERGDVVLIPKNKLHHIVTLEEECYMYILFTEYSEYLKLPHNEEEFVKTKMQVFKEGVDKSK
jgi:quercetin dioxygenase-like cupin family protein